jgi:hypothetical protein
MVQRNEDEAGPSQAIPQPGASWQREGHPATHPHEEERGGTATRLTLFRPSTGQVRATGVTEALTSVLHPWLHEHGGAVLAQIEKHQPGETFPPEEERARSARGETWLGYAPGRPLPPLRMMLVWDTLAGHLSADRVRWFCDHGVMPLSTPSGGSWLNRAASVQRMRVRRALRGQHPQHAQDIIDWLEQTGAGWNQKPTPCVWNGTRRRRRERARLRRVGGSAAALASGTSIAG